MAGKRPEGKRKAARAGRRPGRWGSWFTWRHGAAAIAIVVAVVAAGFAIPSMVGKEGGAALSADVTGSDRSGSTPDAGVRSQSEVEAEAAEAAARQFRKELRKQRRAEKAAKAEKRAARKRQRLAAKAERENRRLRAKKESTFRVGTFNILGSQHTRGSKRWGPGPMRAGLSANLITDRGVDIVGMQEVQNDQLPPLRQGLADYTIWPQQSLGRNSQRLQIAWRTDRFELVEARHSTYVFTSQRIPLPYVRLRDLETKAEFWVMTLHNSAGRLEGQRDAATAHQINVIRDTVAETGKPLLVMGDVNEHQEFYQRVCGATGFAAANGGGGPACALPPRPLRVDWIMGGGGDGVVFSGYVQDGASRARASDHYFIHADVTVKDPGGTP